MEVRSGVAGTVRPLLESISSRIDAPRPMTDLARTPRPPYYAVIFTSIRTKDDDDGYGAMADRMVELGSRQPGFLGIESARGADGLGITVSYWRSTEDAARWKQVAEHLVAQRLGREQWYQSYTLRIAKVEDDWSFERPR